MFNSEKTLEPPPKTLDYFIALFFLLIAACFSIYALDSPSIWVDEAYTWMFSGFSWGKLLEAARIDGVNPPLYYIAVKAFVTFIAADEVGLRVLSVLANLIALFGVLFLGFRIGGRVGMVASGWFWTFHPMTLWYARDARPYALAAAFAVFLILAFFIKPNQPRSLKWTIFTTLLMSLGVITHYFFFVLIASLTTYRVFKLRNMPGHFREWAIMLIISIVPLFMWIYWYMLLPEPSLGIGWIQSPDVFDLPKTIWNLISGYGGVLSFPSTLFGAISLILIVPALLRIKHNTHVFVASVFGVALPLLAVWIISQRRPVYVDRYFIVILPFFVVLLSIGARIFIQWCNEHVSSKHRVILYSIFLLSFFASGTWSGAQIHLDIKFKHEDWRGLVSYQVANAPADSGFWLMEPEVQLPLSFYGLESLEEVVSDTPPRCDPSCWWILRQPYTQTHAFTQSVNQPGREWVPDVPHGCGKTDQWDSPTGIALWQVSCDS